MRQTLLAHQPPITPIVALLNPLLSFILWSYLIFLSFPTKRSCPHRGLFRALKMVGISWGVFMYYSHFRKPVVISELSIFRSAGSEYSVVWSLVQNYSGMKTLVEV